MLRARLFSTLANAASLVSKTPKEARTVTLQRIDTHGNTFVIKEGISYEEAQQRLEAFEKHTHKQGYFIVEDDANFAPETPSTRFR